MIRYESKLRDIRAHPVGRDITDKLLLQLNKPSWLIDNPLIGNLTLKTLRRLAGKSVGAGFFDAVLGLLNAEPDIPDSLPVSPQPAWWKESVFYQIYPHSFAPGGLSGISEKLDYLRELGVDALWLSPVYDSPWDDNGYDVRDYYKILPAFGTMNDMDALIAGTHERGMKIIMDLVINHTSDEHPWFQSALHDPGSPCRDFYFFRPGSPGAPPNNWTSYFGGSAWRYYEEQGVWALHLFSPKQMDLNWACPALREEIYTMSRWWLDKGIDGFRLDVINYISKPSDLPDGDAFIGTLMGYTGIEHYFYGSRLHEYLSELRTQAFEPYQAFSVGETPGVGVQMGRLLTDAGQHKLDLIFSFDHLETPGHTRFEDYRYDLTYLKRFFREHLNADQGHGWNALFFNNHDNPRMISKIDPEGAYAQPLAKLLAVLQLTLRGTPFLYQGDEIGTLNQSFTSIEQLQDVESLGLYAELSKTLSPAEAFKQVAAGTRDHARAPLNWAEIERQRHDPESVWRFYQDLLALRRRWPVLLYGNLEFLRPRNRTLLIYTRRLSDICLYVEANLSPKKQRSPSLPSAERMLGNYDETFSPVLRPYEARIYRLP